MIFLMLFSDEPLFADVDAIEDRTSNCLTPVQILDRAQLNGMGLASVLEKWLRSVLHAIFFSIPKATIFKNTAA